MRRVRGRSLVVFTVAAMLAALPSGATAVSDTTPPTGTFVINDGGDWATSASVTLSFDVTDDVGPIDTVEVMSNGGPWDAHPYAPTLDWTIPDPYGHGDGAVEVNVRWTDAAGNVSAVATDQIVLDTHAPEGTVVQGQGGTGATVALQLNGGDSMSGVAGIRVSPDGVTWGQPVPYTGGHALWPFTDPAYGGSPNLAQRTVKVRVIDVAGNESATQSVSLFLRYDDLEIEVSPGPVTGGLVTFHPTWPAGMSVPSTAACAWTLVWGDDQSIYYGNKNETYGSIGTMAAGGSTTCGDWTLTLPWVPYRQFLVQFQALTLTGTQFAGAILGSEPGTDSVRPALGSTDPRIHSSNLPMVQLLPSTYTPIVGQPITYTGYPLGGATMKATDHWLAGITDYGITKFGGSSWTFTPTRPGSWIVCWDTPTRKYLMSACYDPPTRYRDTTPPNTSAPVQRVGGALLEAGVPVTLTWGGTDRGWGIASYQLQQSVNNGGWATIRLPTAKSTSIVRMLTPGVLVRYRVRATDKAGNVGSWDYGPAFRARVAEEANSSITYAGAWSSAADATAHGGYLRTSTTAGARATFTFTGRDVGLFAERGPGHGKAKVYVDGVLAATVDLNATVAGPRRIVFRREWSAVGSHTVRVIVPGTGIFDIDAFTVLR